MKHKSIIIISLLISINAILSGGYFDSEYITFKQPDKKKFIGRSWGDEFFYWSETESGYRIVKNSQGFWCYAILDEYGDFTSSDSVVAINEPLQSSLNLSRSSARIDSIKNGIDLFNAQVDSMAHYWDVNPPPIGHQGIKIGVVFVEFPDSAYRHYKYTVPFLENGSARPNGYTADDWEGMLFSSDREYSSFDENGSPTETYSASGLEIHGSMREYFYEQTDNIIKISSYSEIVNDIDQNGVPIWWVTDSLHIHENDSIPFVYTLQRDFHLDSLLYINGGPYDALSVIYSGYNLGGEFNPQAFNDTLIYELFYYLTSELHLRGTFGHQTQIGPHAHEFGHVLGLLHPGGDYAPYYYWGLMKVGNNNGPHDRMGTCPAGITPQIKIERGWATFSDTLDSDTMGVVISYDYDDPNYYYVPLAGDYYYPGTETPIWSNHSFIIENRLRDKFDKFTPIPDTDTSFVIEGDPNALQGGMLVWDQDLAYYLRTPDGIEPDTSEDWVDYDSNMVDYAGDNWPLFQGQNFNAQTPANTLIPASDIAGVDWVDPHIAMQNIWWDDDEKTVTFDLYFNAYTGHPGSPGFYDMDTVKTDKYLYGKIFLYTDLVIPDSVTVTVLPGTEIWMDTGKRIRVHGNLIAEGTSTDSILFRQRYSNKWYGVYAENNGTVKLRYVNLNNGTYGIRVQGSSASSDIKNCTFTGNTYGYMAYSNNSELISDNSFIDNTRGVYAYNSDIEISDNIFVDNYYGIFGNSSDFEAINNDIVNESTGYGFYLTGSNPTLSLNDISDCNRGMVCYSSSGPDLTTIRDDGDTDVNNYFHDNISYGVYISSSSSPDMGGHSFDGPPENVHEGGFNYFTDNGTNDVYNNTVTLVPAEANWWENDSPNNGGVGTVYTDPQADDGEVMGEGPGTLPKTSNSEEDLYEFFLDARSAERHGDFISAVAYYDSIIVIGSDSDWINAALIGYQRCYRALELEAQLIEKLVSIIDSHPGELISILARYLSASAHERFGMVDLASQLYFESAQSFGSLEGMEENAAWAFFDIGAMEDEHEGESGVEGLGKASQSFSKVLKDFPGSEAAALLRERFQIKLDETIKQIPGAFALHKANPNPFNPTTTIPFELPKEADVEIIIYDLLGRTVWTFEESAKPAGYYALQWDGLNHNGKLAASGVYLIAFTTPEFRAVQKAVLIR
ncbi:right-handed parallel beta-helix repeat-containing protein [bacterium]|nr:right-handed parallel beta-helix repeat-containing protein [bacterium]